jgi:hypothetical protein
MPERKYTLEIDCFSGRQNPLLEISEEDFAALYKQVMSLNRSQAGILFDGLGFRGFNISDSMTIFLSLQKNIIMIESERNVQYRKNDRAVRSKLIALARKYDKKNNYGTLIEQVATEYL